MMSASPIQNHQVAGGKPPQQGGPQQHQGQPGFVPGVPQNHQFTPQQIQMIQAQQAAARQQAMMLQQQQQQQQQQPQHQQQQPQHQQQQQQHQQQQQQPQQFHQQPMGGNANLQGSPVNMAQGSPQTSGGAGGLRMNQLTPAQQQMQAQFLKRQQQIQQSQQFQQLPYQQQQNLMRQQQQLHQQQLQQQAAQAQAQAQAQQQAAAAAQQHQGHPQQPQQHQLQGQQHPGGAGAGMAHHPHHPHQQQHQFQQPQHVQLQQQHLQQQPQHVQPPQQQIGPVPGGQGNESVQQAAALAGQIPLNYRKPGAAIIKTLQLCEAIANAGENGLEVDFWRRIGHEYFSDNGILKVSVSNNKDITKSFEVPVPVMPRYYLTYFNAGVKQIQFQLENPREFFTVNNGYLVTCSKASTIFRFHDDTMVTVNSPLKLLFNGALKIDWMEHDLLSHTEYLSRSAVAAFISRNDNNEDGSGNWYSLAPCNITNFGVSASVMRFFEISETLAQMKELIAVCQDNNNVSGPAKALELTIHRINAERARFQSQQPQQPQDSSRQNSVAAAAVAAAAGNQNNVGNHSATPEQQFNTSTTPNGEIAPSPMISHAAYQNASTAGASATKPSPRLGNKRRRSTKGTNDDQSSKSPKINQK